MMNETREAQCRAWAEQAAVERLLNAYLREREVNDPTVGCEEPCLRVELPNTKRTLLGVMDYVSPFGHHRYGEAWRLQEADGTILPLAGLHMLADALLSELAAEEPDAAQGRERVAAMMTNIANSVEKTTQYLLKRRDDLPLWSLQGEAKLVAAEQSLLFGHPFHPTPKSSEGFAPDDLERYAPEMGAAFRMHYFAAAPNLVQEAFLAGDGEELIPEAVREAACLQLATERQDFRLLPCHPWQAQYLRNSEAVQELLKQGLLVDLGPLGDEVHPTSSVRTVWHPQHPYFYKLPLNVRITHFVRVNPLDQLARTFDASRVLQTLVPVDASPNFHVLLEAGYRTLKVPDAAPDLQAQLAESFGVIFRENPAQRPVEGEPPLVVATLLEQRPWEAASPLLQAVRAAADAQGAALDADFLKKWLRSYLDLSLLPLMRLFTQYGVSIEAHVQNSLVMLKDGWPERFYVRDLEGVSISRTHAERCGFIGGLILADSEVLYEESEAWQRLQYFFFVNHLGHLIYALGSGGGVSERDLWQVVGETLMEADFLQDGEGRNYVEKLLTAEGLPAKANLGSAFRKRGERPSYAAAANLMIKREVTV